MFGDFDIFVHYNINLQVQLQIYSTLKILQLSRM